jgi:hypothetical protein
MESILTSIKKLLAIEDDYTHFDMDIIMNINSVLMTLTQLGVGPTAGFTITSNTETWTDFLGEQFSNLEGVKTYIYLKVRLVFDPPTSSGAIDAMTRIATEIEWRLNLQAEQNRIAAGAE